MLNEKLADDQEFIIQHSSFNIRFYTPGWVFAILASVKDADLVAVRVGQVGFAPEPFAVSGTYVKVEAEGLEAFNVRIKVVAFEIKDDVVKRHTPYRSCFRRVDGESAIAVGAFKSRVSRQRIDNKFKAELLEKLGRFNRFIRINSNLVQVHVRSPYFSRRSLSERPSFGVPALAGRRPGVEAD